MGISFDRTAESLMVPKSNQNMSPSQLEEAVKAIPNLSLPGPVIAYALGYILANPGDGTYGGLAKPVTPETKMPEMRANIGGLLMKQFFGAQLAGPSTAFCTACTSG
jgi:hypothetical protein